MTGAAPPRRHGTVAYLVNLYPAPSHSFIRREIAALEEAGWQVHRFSHRAGPATVDPDDERERTRTAVLLATPLPQVLGEVLRWWLTHPLKSFAALAASLAMAWRSNSRFIAHLGYYALACVLARRLRALGCEHVHAHFGTNPAAVAHLAHRLADIRYSLTFHGPHEFRCPDRLDLRTKVSAASFVATVSRHGLRLMHERHAVHAHKFVEVPCGLDATWWHARPAPMPALPRLVCVARLEPQKDPLLLLEAASRLHRAGVPLHLVIVGDGSLRSAVKSRRDALGLREAVTLAGWCTQEQVREHLRAARALVLSSHDEGLPVAVMEAFAMHRPAIAPDVGGMRELVQTGVTGWLCPRGDVHALAEAMRQALTLPAQSLAQLAMRGWRRVQSHDVQQAARILGERFADASAEPPPIGTPAFGAGFDRRVRLG